MNNFSNFAAINSLNNSLNYSLNNSLNNSLIDSMNNSLIDSWICAGNAINFCLSIVSFPLNFILLFSTIKSTLAVGPKILLGNLAFSLILLSASEAHRTVKFLYIYSKYNVFQLRIDRLYKFDKNIHLSTYFA